MNLYVYRCPDCPGTVALREGMRDVICWAHGGREVRMACLPNTTQALLPMDAMHEGVAVRLGPMNVDTLKAAGILLPATQHALEWLYRHRATNGMAGAFCKVGGRRCIDLVAFARLMREQRA